MVSLEIKLEWPEGLAREAEAGGLLTPESIEALIREAVRRRRIDDLFRAADRLAALDVPPLTEEELEAEIRAARNERADHPARGG